MITIPERIQLDELIRKLRDADEECHKVVMGWSHRSTANVGAARADALFDLSEFISSITEG